MENSASISKTLKNPRSGQISLLGPLRTFRECTTNKVFINFSDYTFNFDFVQLSVVSTSFCLCERRKRFLHFEMLPSLSRYFSIIGKWFSTEFSLNSNILINLMDHYFLIIRYCLWYFSNLSLAQALRPSPPLPFPSPRVFAAYKLLYLHTWDSSSPVASHCHTHAPAEIHREEISKLPVAKNHLSHRPNTKNLKIRRTRLAKFWDLKVLTTGRRVSTMSPTFYKKKCVVQHSSAS